MEKRLALSLASLTGVGLIIAAVFFVNHQSDQAQQPCTMEAKLCPDGSSVGRSGPRCEFSACPDTQSHTSGAPTENSDERAQPDEHTDQGNVTISKDLSSPLERADERVTKKPFGILIDPKTSPVQPERFSGYHTGVDFETFPEEATTDVPVRALCEGKVLTKRSVSGYGGVVVTDCEVDGQKVTVLYGHLALASVPVVVDAQVSAGMVLGNLGQGYSRETDGERKHLHVAIHRDSSVNVSGYVDQSSALSAWLDPCVFLACYE